LKTKTKSQSAFKMIDFGSINDILGINIRIEELTETIHLFQKNRIIEKILHD